MLVSAVCGIEKCAEDDMEVARAESLRHFVKEHLVAVPHTSNEGSTGRSALKKQSRRQSKR
jgi:hypothetical protein